MGSEMCIRDSYAIIDLLLPYIEDIEADMDADLGRGEAPSMMEPLRISNTSKYYTALADLAVELSAKSTGLKRSLPYPIVDALSDLVRSMNCYYSNLIEGHDTHPVDIERALNEDYSADPKKRDLQLEARAHIHVQKWICLLYTSPSPRDLSTSRMPSSA